MLRRAFFPVAAGILSIVTHAAACAMPSSTDRIILTFAGAVGIASIVVLAVQHDREAGRG